MGYDGDGIPTNDEQLDREELLGAVLFGAGYYDAVHRGPTQSSLERQIAILNAEMDSALQEHHRLAMCQRRPKSDPPLAIVAEVKLTHPDA